MRVVLAFEIGEIVGEQHAAARPQRVERTGDQVLRAIGSLGATDVTEDDDVVRVGFDRDRVEVTGTELAPVGDREQLRLLAGDVDHVIEVVDHRSPLAGMR